MPTNTAELRFAMLDYSGNVVPGLTPYVLLLPTGGPPWKFADSGPTDLGMGEYNVVANQVDHFPDKNKTLTLLAVAAGCRPTVERYWSESQSGEFDPVAVTNLNSIYGRGWSRGQVTDYAGYTVNDEPVAVLTTTLPQRGENGYKGRKIVFETMTARPQWCSVLASHDYTESYVDLTRLELSGLMDSAPDVDDYFLIGDSIDANMVSVLFGHQAANLLWKLFQRDSTIFKVIGSPSPTTTSFKVQLLHGGPRTEANWCKGRNVSMIGPDCVAVGQQSKPAFTYAVVDGTTGTLTLSLPLTTAPSADDIGVITG